MKIKIRSGRPAFTVSVGISQGMMGKIFHGSV